MGINNKVGGVVDVRGVIRAVIAELRADGNTGHVQSLLDADSAVAELIEKATAILSHNPAHCDTDEEAALRAALANVGPQS